MDTTNENFNLSVCVEGIETSEIETVQTHSCA